MPVLSRTELAITLSVAAYFALLLVPNGFPRFAGTSLFFVYLASVPVALLALVAVGTWGSVGLLRSRGRAEPLNPRHRTLVLVGCVGLASFALALVLMRTVPRSLPTGSHLQRFDRAVWQDPSSVEHVRGDITSRQKMLADVVKHVLPGRTRAELERILGPSLETAYFKSSGRDLIYLLGPQRDFFFAIDSEWLLIWLDKDGRFARYAIAND